MNRHADTKSSQATGGQVAEGTSGCSAAQGKSPKGKIEALTRRGLHCDRIYQM